MHSPTSHTRLPTIVWRTAVVLVVACSALDARADAKAGEQKAQLCLLCHKEAVDKRFVPLLEGQPVDYLVAALMAFKTGQRKSPDMDLNVASLSRKDIRDIAEYFAAKSFPSRHQTIDPARVGAGQQLVREMQCTSCHGPHLQGAGAVAGLAGQKSAYLAWQLDTIRRGQRPHPLGSAILKDAAEIEPVASYLSSLR
jgi:cytochrome c553